MSINQTIANKLRTARQRRGVSQMKCAAVLGVSRSTYRNMEFGKREIPLEHLSALAPLLGLNIERLAEPELAMTQVRSKYLSRAKMFLAVQGKFISQCSIQSRLEGKHTRKGIIARVRENRKRLLCLRDEIRLNADLDPEGVACEFHAQLNPMIELPDNPLHYIEKCGVHIILMPVMSYKMQGLCTLDPDHGPAIGVTVWDRLSAERTIFLAMHELGHILMHDGFNDEYAREDRQADHEANLFAMHALVPSAGFKPLWNGLYGMTLLERMLYLKRRYHVSLKLMVRATAAHLELDPEQLWTDLFVEYRRTFGKRLAGNVDGPENDPDSFYERYTAKEPCTLPHSMTRPLYAWALARIALETRTETASNLAHMLATDQNTVQGKAAFWL